jgi:hypothetical protein
MLVSTLKQLYPFFKSEYLHLASLCYYITFFFLHVLFAVGLWLLGYHEHKGIHIPPYFVARQPFSPKSGGLEPNV